MSVTTIPSLNALSIFNTIPGCHLILLPDAPRFTIVGATDSYLGAMYLNREKVIGAGVFETLTENIGYPGASGVKHLSLSLEYVVQQKAEQQMAEQRFDILNPAKGTLEYRVWKPHNKPVFDEQGEVQYIIHSVADVTENIFLRAEKGVSDQRLEDSVAFTSKILEGSPDCVKILNEEGRVVFMNDNGRCIMEIDHFSDVHYKLWADLWGDENREKVNSAISAALKGAPAHFQAYCPTAKGTPKWWDVMVSPVPDTGSGKVTNLISVSRDITSFREGQRRLEESEARFRSMIEQAPVAIGYTRGDDMIFESINEPMLELIGRSRKTEILQKTVTEALPELVNQPVFEVLKNVQQTGETFRGTAVPATLSIKGVLSLRYYDITYSPILDPDGIRCVLHMAVDVTEQVMARKKLEASQRSLLTLFNEAPVGIATITANEDLLIETANVFFSQLVDRDPNDMIGRPLLGALPELSGQGFDQLLKDVIDTATAFAANEVPVELVRQQKRETIYVNMTYQPRMEGEKVSGVLVVATDVTEQVMNRKKVEQNEHFVRNIFFNSPVAHLVYVGENMVVQEVNEKMLEILGRTGEIVGQPILEAIPEFKTTAISEHYQSVLATGRPHEEQGRQIMIIKNGAPYLGYYDFTFKPLTSSEGKVYGTICSAIDVTEQVLARQTLEEKELALESAYEQVRLSKEAAELGTFDINMSNGDMHWDERCRTLFGISHNQPVSFDLDFIKRLHPDDEQRVLGLLAETFDKSVSGGKYDVEYRTIGADDGVVRWVRAKGQVYFDDHDKPVRFIGSVLDITSQKTAIHQIEKLVEERTRELAEANESLLSMNTELQRSNSNLEEFAHAASHDLKEPVRKVLTFTDRLKLSLGDRLNESEISLFSRVESATQRMGALIEDLLIYSHVSQRPMEMEPVDLNVKVQRVLEDLELDIEESGAAVEVAALPVVAGYKRQLQQVFQNLLSNALKYRKQAVSPRVHITASVVHENGKAYHAVSVQDNGIGFEQHYEEKIFQMFSRLHGKGEYSGTGIGLSIVKKVVENHHGFIRVTGKPNVGSRFTVYIPQN